AAERARQYQAQVGTVQAKLPGLISQFRKDAVSQALALANLGKPIIRSSAGGFVSIDPLTNRVTTIPMPAGTATAKPTYRVIDNNLLEITPGVGAKVIYQGVGKRQHFTIPNVGVFDYDPTTDTYTKRIAITPADKVQVIRNATTGEVGTLNLTTGHYTVSKQGTAPAPKGIRLVTDNQGFWRKFDPATGDLQYVMGPDGMPVKAPPKAVSGTKTKGPTYVKGKNGNYWVWDYDKKQFDDSGTPFAPTGAGTGAAKAKTWIQMVKDANARIDKYFRPLPPQYIEDRTGKQVVKKGTGRQPPNYFVALGQLLANGDGSVRWAKKAQQLLQSRPYYQDGKNGSPYASGSQVSRHNAWVAAVAAREGGNTMEEAKALAMATGRYAEADIDWALSQAYKPRLGPPAVATGPRAEAGEVPSYYST